MKSHTSPQDSGFKTLENESSLSIRKNPNSPLLSESEIDISNYQCWFYINTMNMLMFIFMLLGSHMLTDIIITNKSNVSSREYTSPKGERSARWRVLRQRYLSPVNFQLFSSCDQCPHFGGPKRSQGSDQEVGQLRREGPPRKGCSPRDERVRGTKIFLFLPILC